MAPYGQAFAQMPHFLPWALMQRSSHTWATMGSISHSSECRIRAAREAAAEPVPRRQGCPSVPGGARQEDAVGGRVHRAQLGMVFHEESAGALGDVQHRADRIHVRLGDRRLVEHDHLVLMLDHLAQRHIFGLDVQVVGGFVLGDQCGAPLDEADAHLARPVVEFFIALAKACGYPCRKW